MPLRLPDDATALVVDPASRYDLSPYLYMQFMEPLGATDGSVAAAWDHLQDRWREDLIDATKELAPTLIRWGGCLSSYYRWQEGVGPRDERIPMLNLLWGGVESNQVGTGEFLDFCNQVGADPLLSVNFESDGRQQWAQPAKGGSRCAGPDEAAQWVDYCNNPDNPLRQAHSAITPYDVRMWQIGNETSYDRHGYDLETTVERTIAFAQTMRQADPSIQLIGWGEGRWTPEEEPWAPTMIERAGEYLDILAFHHMFAAGSREPGSPLTSETYRLDPAQTWSHLMDAFKDPEAKIGRMRQQVAGYDMPLAITECHFSLPGRNRCELLSSWAAGVANARILHVHERNGDLIKIATLADFCGNRWQVNAIMMPTPGGQSFMMPVARVMSLYRHHVGQSALDVTRWPADLDVTASRTDDTIYLHVINTSETRSAKANLAVVGETISSGALYELCDDPWYELISHAPDRLAPVEHPLPRDGCWTFPPASVTAVELQLGD